MGVLHICSLRFNSKILKLSSIPVNQIASVSTRLVEIGHLEHPNTPELSYEPGQLFLHKLFPYRGIVLFPWRSKILDGEISEYETDQLDFAGRKKTYNREGFYYQVLVDSSDRQYLCDAMKCEAVTIFENSDPTKGLNSVPGMDFASHEDIQPYTLPKGSLTMHNDLFDSFFSFEPSKANPVSVKPALKTWRLINSPWLRLSQVYIETTEDVRVTAIPFYIGHQKTRRSKKYWWRYLVRLENIGKHQMQLRSHHWRVFVSSGPLDDIRGQGVVGHEPYLDKRFPVFQYSSHISLYAPSGYMWGTYEMDREDGSRFECRVPMMELKSKDDFEAQLPILKD